LYLTWARQNAPETQKAITDAYVAIGEELGAVIIPVGVAWQNFIRKHSHPVLHDQDKSQSHTRRLLPAACVFFCRLI